MSQQFYRNKAKELNHHISVDCVLFGLDSQNLKVLLLEREITLNGNGNGKQKSGKIKDHLLPGNLVLDTEGLDDSANRILSGFTKNKVRLYQFYCFGDPNRVNNETDQAWLQKVRINPQARVITLAYLGTVLLGQFKKSSAFDELNANWHEIQQLPKMGFDHKIIVHNALEILKLKIQFIPLGLSLLPERFTLSHLQSFYENILGRKFDKRNFRRKFISRNLLIELDEKYNAGNHRPAQLYTVNKEKLNYLSDSSAFKMGLMPEFFINL